MTDNMKTKLLEYLNRHEATILETAGTKCCELRYKPSCGNKTFIMGVAFCKHFHNIDPYEYEIGDNYYAIVFPGYWLSMPNDVAFHYIEFFIDQYMRKKIFGKGDNEDSGDNNTGNNKPGCNCPKPPIKPPCPKPSLEVNLHDDPNGQLNGYFIAGQE